MTLHFRLLAAVALTAWTCAACTGTAAVDDTSDEATESSADELRARFTSRSSPTDADLASLHRASKKFEYGFLGVYRFNRAGPEATDPVARMKRVKEVMHRYMCSYFDESIDLGRPTGAGRVNEVVYGLELQDYAYENPPSDVASFKSALSRVFADPKLDLMSGYASGNNTSGQVMGVYDMRRHEILFFGFTNCGSDG